MSENLLRHSASPYLLQHKDNPVHWRPWGPEAIAEAKAAGKPILLSVGYAACHWCHVMAHESFEDEATAAVMNRLFVPIKVDREERPDVDQIYMAALHALGEQGGWPLTMFLTPDAEPIWGGTYFPKTARYGRPAFTAIMEEVARLFRDEPEKIEKNRAYIAERLAATAPRNAGVAMDDALLDAAAERLRSLMDPVNGGTRGAPKFPQATLLEFLWRAGLRPGGAPCREIVLTTLRHIAQGGIYDHVAGGFARYSVDENWLVPHFEKMLYDNAQLVELMTYAALATREPLFETRIAETVAWLEREMQCEGGAFAASLDADAAGHEGGFALWSPEEVNDVLGAEEGAFFSEIYDITPNGNFEGASIPNRLAHMDLLDDAAEARLAAARAKLLARRQTRPQPARDDKILADWNGLAIAALAFAGASLDRPEWIALAARAYASSRTTMMKGDRLAHAWRDGKSVPGLATDYAAMAKAALALHSATQEQRYLAEAEAFAATLRAHHWNDAEPGYFLSADDAEALIVRPKATTDEATPSATSVASQVLVRLWHLTGADRWRADVDAILGAAGGVVAENLFAGAGLLSALDLRLHATDVVIVTPSSGGDEALRAVARAHATPNTILSVHQEAVTLPPARPAAGKTTVDGRATAYVCRGETCSLPVTEPAALAALLGGAEQ